MSEANWEEYYGYLHAVLDDKNSKFNINEDDYEYRLLRSFFDIYENKYKNDIVDKLAFKNLSASGRSASSARASSRVLPFIRASAWAKALATVKRC